MTSPHEGRYAIDPELAGFAAFVQSVNLTDAATTRARMHEFSEATRAGVDISDLHVDDLTVPGPDGAPDVAVRMYASRARPDAPVPAVLYIHGGGFYAGSVDSVHAGAAELARELHIVVLSVDYRLAPEHPFPAALEDCYAALLWTHERAEELGMDASRIAVLGGSAGAGLAAGLALLTRDRSGPTLCFQFLSIPMLDDRLETPSMHRFTDTPMVTRASTATSWAWYLGDWTGEVPPYAAPARAADLSGVPPAYVSVMEFDPLRDEGITYASRLLEAGVTVELHCFPGTFHGSGGVADAVITRRERAERLQVLQRALRL